jgi:hypothetical protein
MTVMMINLMKLHNELVLAGLPIVGVSSDGRVDFDGTETPENIEAAALIVAAHDPSEPFIIPLEERIMAIEDVLIEILTGG